MTEELKEEINFYCNLKIIIISYYYVRVNRFGKGNFDFSRLFKQFKRIKINVLEEIRFIFIFFEKIKKFLRSRSIYGKRGR